MQLYTIEKQHDCLRPNEWDFLCNVLAESASEALVEAGERFGYSTKVLRVRVWPGARTPGDGPPVAPSEAK